MSNNTHIDFSSSPSGARSAIFDIPWSKTEGSKGAKIVLTDLNDPTSPVPALRHHLAANTNVPAGASLFVFETDDGGWEPLTKSNWLARCNEIWVAAGFAPLKAHAFRIGGCTELLLCGTNPDIVCVQGRWKSRAFLVYWRKIQKLLPLFISNSFSASCRSCKLLYVFVSFKILVMAYFYPSYLFRFPLFRRLWFGIGGQMIPALS